MIGVVETQLQLTDRYHQHEVLAMVNTDEGGIFVTPKTASMPLEEYITTLFPKMSAEDAKKAAALYEGLGDLTRLQQMVMGEGE